MGRALVHQVWDQGRHDPRIREGRLERGDAVEDLAHGEAVVERLRDGWQVEVDHQVAEQRREVAMADVGPAEAAKPRSPNAKPRSPNARSPQRRMSEHPKSGMPEVRNALRTYVDLKPHSSSPPPHPYAPPFLVGGTRQGPAGSLRGRLQLLQPRVAARVPLPESIAPTMNYHILQEAKRRNAESHERWMCV